MINTDSPSALVNTSVVFRNFFFILLLILELVVLTIRFDTQSFENINFPLLNLLGYSGDLLRFGVGVVGAFIVFSSSKLKLILALFSENSPNRHWKFWLLAHMLLMAGLYALTYLIFEGIPEGIISKVTIVNLTIISWLLLGIFVLLCWLLALASYTYWLQFIRQEGKIILLSVIAGFVAWGVAQLSEIAWQPLANLTFWSAYHTLDLFYTDVIFDVSSKMLGTSLFKVIISPQCSGYEGIGLIVVFLSVYLWISRKHLRFPQVYLLFPVGIAAIWLLNTLRIALLIAIGSSFSPEIAIGGFHSNAGWIAFVFISVGLVLVCQQIKLFNKNPVEASHSRSTHGTSATALLLPFVIMLACLLLTSAFIVKFDWLYPLRVLVIAGVLWFFRSYYLAYIKNISASSVLIGTVVFVIWILLVPSSGQASNEFASELFSVSPVLSSGWLFFRIIGASIAVPIVEELAFRGYLMAKLVDSRFETVKPGQFTWFSFLVSSLLFGVLHGDWLAGTIAGMCFAFAVYKRGELFDAIIAHMTANILLVGYILFTSNWSLW